MNKLVVSFDLTLPAESKEILASLMLARGYSQKHVLYCFQQLQDNGMGEFDRGSQGRGRVAKFIPNENCPGEICIEFEVKKKGRPRKTRED